MMNKKHTPGPWKIGVYVDQTSDDGEAGHIPITRDDGAHVADVLLLDSDDEQAEANARLIAASPMLYDYVQSKAKEGCNNAKEIIAKLGID